MAGGGGEQALLTAASMQMAKHYGFCSSTIAGATDSKLPDAQSGYEKCLNVSQTVHSGANIVTQASGAQAGLMGISFEAMVIDNDMLGAILRSTAKVDVSEDTVSPSAIGIVATGVGHFLGEAETYARMHIQIFSILNLLTYPNRCLGSGWWHPIFAMLRPND